ncbi:AMP-binding protein [Priestia endophytica]|uniref:AMP-binding protein n=1 Tax=Priestia endophytica TaxID=135735 RepID=UPI000F536450|nr:AMP-binding protein [Priestia endophytica]RPK15254.1 Phenylacetate-coenzyme A ligase [Priestia endophytica]
MNTILKKVYLSSPFLIKKIFANVEGIRRNYYRKKGDYKQNFNAIDTNTILTKYDQEQQVKDINSLLTHVSHKIPYYKNINTKEHINSLDEFELVPLISKNIMKKNIKEFINEEKIAEFWKGSTSGSTGTPFFYYRDKKSLQFHYALYDKICEYLSKDASARKARISGVSILSTKHKRPPFWYFINTFNQLQCSTYHINRNTYKYYLKAFQDYNVKWGSGYASAWLHLAENILDHEYEFEVRMKAIITDSEGLSNKQKSSIETAFGCSVYPTYGLSEIGTVAVQCENNHYHILSQGCYVEIVNEEGIRVKKGQEGEIVVTDLHSYNAPFIRYRTGDTGILGTNNCGCGWNTPYIKELCGRVEDYILTKDGMKVKRLGHLAKPAKGIIGMQLIQEKPGYLSIKVLPTNDFEADSMDKVLELACEYLGDTKVTWELVDELEKTKSGKIRYIIRRF